VNEGLLTRPRPQDPPDSGAADTSYFEASALRASIPSRAGLEPQSRPSVLNRVGVGLLTHTSLELGPLPERSTAECSDEQVSVFPIESTNLGVRDGAVLDWCQQVVRDPFF